MCHLAHPSHPSKFNNSSIICWGEKVVKLSIMIVSPAFCCFLPLSPKTYHKCNQSITFDAVHPVVFFNLDYLQ
jgi:hypothetical protein